MRPRPARRERRGDRPPQASRRAGQKGRPAAKVHITGTYLGQLTEWADPIECALHIQEEHYRRRLSPPQ